MDTMTKREAAAILGRLGGEATARRPLTEAQRQARRANAAKATAARMAQREADAVRVAALVP